MRIFYYARIKKMNILLAADVSIKDRIGGGERVLHEQSVRLAQKGHKVCILTRRLPAHTSAYETIDGVHEYRYDVNMDNPAAFLLTTVLNGQKLYKQLSLGTKFDVINCHQPFSALAVNLFPGTWKIKKVYTCHSLSFEEYISRNPQKESLGFTLNVFLRMTIERFCLNKAARIIALSRFTKDKLVKTHRIPEHKIAILPGAADVDYFKPVMEKDVLRKELDIPPQPLVLFTVRNLVARMGLENLVKAVPILQKKGADVRLFIGGQGVLKENLLALVKELGIERAVTLCGFLSKETLLKNYQMADFFILPTIELEGFGLVTVEAMACGAPVLATPIGGSVEILGAFDRSFLFKDTSPEAMAELIFEKYAYYKNKPDEYARLCADARAFVEKNYSWEKNVHDLEGLLCAA